MPPADGRTPKVIGDLTIYPIGEGTSLGEYVRAAERAIGSVPGLRTVPGPMSTALEADDLSTIFTAVGKAHDALVAMGARRISVQLRIDHRLDKSETIEYKVGRIQGLNRPE